MFSTKSPGGHLAQCCLKIHEDSTNVSELVPVELWKEEGNVDITVGACTGIVFDIRTKEIGGGKQIMIDLE